jgi:NTE family protein
VTPLLTVPNDAMTPPERCRLLPHHRLLARHCGRALAAAFAASVLTVCPPVSAQLRGPADASASGAAAPAGVTPFLPEAKRPEAMRPRVGLALSGGGARGFAHVGVLRALEAMRIPVDCIAGTSAGSAVGAAYASGLSPDQIERALRSADWDRDMFDDAPPRRDQEARRKNEEKAYLLDVTIGIRDGSVLIPPGLVSGQKIELFLHRMLGTSSLLESFDRLPIPFRAIATDLEIGEMVVQDRGSLVTAVRASMAVPSAFSPVASNGRLLVDGGLTRNMPVDVVRTMCADVVLAIDIGGPLMKREELSSAFGVAGQMLNILMERNMRASRAEVRPGQDVLIRPDLGDIGSTAFSRGVDGIPAGEAATHAAAGALSHLVVSPEDYAAWQQARAARVVRDDRYSGVRVVGTDRATSRALLAQAAMPVAGTLDRRRLESAINTWNSSGDFDRIGYSLKPEGPDSVLELEVLERGWGPNFLRFGLGAAADSRSNGVFNVLLGYRRPRINDWGGEFKTELQFGSTSRLSAELYQPFNRGDARYFAAPQFHAEEVPVWLFVGGNRVAEYGVRTTQIGLDLGVGGRIGEVRLGAYAGNRDTFARTGSVLLPEVKDDYWGGQVSLVADQLDATDFPREGYLLGITARSEEVSSNLRGRYSTHRVQVSGKQVASWGRHTLAGAFRFGEASEQIALNEAFSLGGFMNLSGLQVNQLLGTSLRYASLNYQNQLLTLPNPLGRGLYGGLAVEGGQMRGLSIGLNRDGWIGGVTGYLGAHTAIGPVYLGYGIADNRNRLVYLFLGRPGL